MTIESEIDKERHCRTPQCWWMISVSRGATKREIGRVRVKMFERDSSCIPLVPCGSLLLVFFWEGFVYFLLLLLQLFFCLPSLFLLSLIEFFIAFSLCYDFKLTMENVPMIIKIPSFSWKRQIIINRSQFFMKRTNYANNQTKLS